MKWTDIKERIIREFAIVALDVVYIAAKRFAKEELKHDFLYSFRTPTHRVRVLAVPGDPYLIVRPKGFGKLWKAIEKKDIPAVMAEEVFAETCTPERRKQLVKKITGLRAFW
jgi:hypothetical protein